MATATWTEAERAEGFELFDLVGTAAAIAAANGSGLLDAILDGPATPADLATRLNLDARAAAAVLDVLVATGFAGRDGDAYTATSGLRAMHDLFPAGMTGAGGLWTRLPAFLAEGSRARAYDGAVDERDDVYQDTVAALGRLFAAPAAELAERLPPASDILDVGPGSGVWSLAMAERHPGTRVTGFDLPGVAEVFLAHAERRGLGDRVRAMAGDFNETALPGSAFDRAVLANVVHLEPPESARDLVARVAATLRPGGDLVIVEPSHGGTAARDRAVAVYGLHLTMRTDRGQAYDLALLDALLRSAGLVPQGPVALGSAPGVLVAAIGRRPA